jgi:peptide/nickel transport system permease protein
MRNLIFKRLVYTVFLMWLMATTVFFGLRLVPGGPAATMLGTRATPERVENLRESLGLNEPLHVQYFEWMGDLAQLDMGTSIRSGQEVSEILLLALPKTVSIGILAVLIGLLIAIPAGVISATHRGEYSDYIATFIAFFGLSSPSFFIAILLLIIFGVQFDILPTFGYTPISEGVVPWFKSILLPAIAVGLPYTAVVMRMMRSSLLEVLNAEYMKTARAKGISTNVSLYKHALQNALIPVLTVAGLQLAVIIGGSVTVEIVFGIKGLGRVIVQSITNRNYPVTQGVIMLIAAGFLLINLFVDIAYTVVNPKIRYGDDQL